MVTVRYRLKYCLKGPLSQKQTKQKKTKGFKLHVHLWNLVFRLVFSSVLQIWYVELRIFRSVSEGPFNFEITRVDCILTTDSVISLSVALYEKKLANKSTIIDFNETIGNKQ